MFSDECVGTYARFHDTIHSLQAMDDPPWEYTIVPLRHHHGRPTSNVLFEDGPSPFRLVNFLRNVAKASRRADVVHLIQGDFPYSLLVPLVAKQGIPLVAGPNVSAAVVDLERRTRVLSDLSSRHLSPTQLLQIVKPYSNKLVFNRRSPVSSFYQRIFVFPGYYSIAIGAGGMAERKLRVLPPGVRTDIFRPSARHLAPEKKFLILYIGDGRRTYLKGYDILLKAFQHLESRGISFRAIVLGKRTHKSDEMTSQCNLNTEIESEGFIPRHGLPPFYRRADVFVCPSRWESDPTTIAEALACGTPVVSTVHPSLRGVSQALAFQREDAEQLCERLIEVYQNRERYRRLALRESSQWDIKFVIQKFLDTYVELVS